MDEVKKFLLCLVFLFIATTAHANIIDDAALFSERIGLPLPTFTVVREAFYADYDMYDGYVNIRTNEIHMWPSYFGNDAWESHVFTHELAHIYLWERLGIDDEVLTDMVAQCFGTPDPNKTYVVDCDALRKRIHDGAPSGASSLWG